MYVDEVRLGLLYKETYGSAHGYGLINIGAIVFRGRNSEGEGSMEKINGIRIYIAPKLYDDKEQYYAIGDLELHTRAVYGTKHLALEKGEVNGVDNLGGYGNLDNTREASLASILEGLTYLAHAAILFIPGAEIGEVILLATDISVHVYSKLNEESDLQDYSKTEVYAKWHYIKYLYSQHSNVFGDFTKWSASSYLLEWKSDPNSAEIRIYGTVTWGNLVQDKWPTSPYPTYHTYISNLKSDTVELYIKI